jgi:hypothetical protein
MDLRDVPKRGPILLQFSPQVKLIFQIALIKKSDPPQEPDN